MRDRLIELLKKIKYTPFEDCNIEASFINQFTEYAFNHIVDEILKNGVIVPPCKVGDKVYFNKAEIAETCPAKVIGIYNNYYTPSMPLWITIEYESKLIGRQEVKMWSNVFELLCYYSKEEAEQALKGGAE